MKFPLSNVIFETAKACNLSCKYCYNHWRQPGSTFDDASDKVRWKTLKRIIKKIDFQRITFTGGEPFLIKDLEEHILYCRMKKKAVNVISNGNCGTDERYTVLDELGVSIMQFPLLADNSEVHDSLTNQIGSFDKVLNSIKFFRDRKANVCTVFVMTKKNISYIEQTIKYAEKLGVNNFMLARFNIGGMGIHNVDELLISSKLLNNAFQLAEDMAPKLNIKLSANVCVPHCVVNPTNFKNLHISSCSSDFRRRPVTIDAFGNVRLCNHSPKVVGNIHKDKIEDMMKSDYVKSWENSKPVFCNDCALWEKCHGGCRAASEQVNGSIDKEDPIVVKMLV